MISRVFGFFTSEYLEWSKQVSIECMAEDCENIAVWSLPPYKAADHYCHKHYREMKGYSDNPDDEADRRAELARSEGRSAFVKGEGRYD